MTPRDDLLERAIAWIAQNGISDLSLRRLAQGLGTSHRMLIHHFGSKQGLWVAVIREVEQRQRAVMDEMLADEQQPTFESAWAWWKHISDPALWANERLFFEVYGQALQGREHTAGLLDGIVDGWVEPAARRGAAAGIPAPAARALSRLGVAVTRGLLLDLLATGEVEAVDRAMAMFLESSFAAAPAPGSVARPSV